MITNNFYYQGIIHFIPQSPVRLFSVAFVTVSTVFHSQSRHPDTLSTAVQTVEIIGRKSKDYTSDYSFAATKIAMKNKDLPLSLNTVTKELITDRQAFQLGDVMKNVNGVSPSSYYNQYNIRGISQNEEGQIINGMRTRQYYFLQPMTSNIERVEVFKGPASITMSSADPGGTINMVTKKPLSVSRHEISLSGGSYDTFRIAADLTGPLNKSKTLLYRFNGAYQNAQSFREHVKNSGILFSPSVTFVPNEKTSVNVEMIFNDLYGNLDRGQPIFGAVAGKTDLNSTPRTLNLGAPDDFFKTRDLMIMGSVAHHFNRSVSFNASYMKQYWRENLQEHRTTNSFVPDMNNKPISNLAMMQFVQRKQKWAVDNINAYFNFTFKTGPVHHQALIGYDNQIWEKRKGGQQNAARGFLLKDGSVVSSYNPAKAADYQTVNYNGILLPKPNVDPFDLTPGAENHQGADFNTINITTALPSALTTTHAAYIQHLLTWKKFKILSGIREEWFQDTTNFRENNESSFKNNKLLYRFGITYSLTDHLNLYGTYLTGYQPQSNTVTLMPNTSSLSGSESAARFKPLTSDLKELGIKAQLSGKISLNIAVYEINQRNILINANNPSEPDELVQRGADRSRGFEAELTGYILPQWHIYGGYSCIDAKILDDTNPDLVGKRKENTSKHSVNVWTRYNFSAINAVKDFGVGIGVLYQSSKVPWFTRSFEIPAYTTIDAAIYYSPPSSHIQLSFNLNNITNRVYWIGAQNYLRLFPGAPRNYLLTATYKF
ncbi:TonB-dependent siderophore receptor [Chryseobacterium indologenes]|uniref:TonB-dependent siderophore receptor n=1 Tax=Chryseobacterium indologenes TaxID=253 RepID=UPI0003E07085|nr:TonB-dependent siderophore receptor [Chryseobacterium indologenes]QPQ51704.1 TonB-dependent siderophore receptor [Chryseobacterium indologenes]GAE64449.1 putative TonB-dependent receptor [Chryseobacterium indologenes NBRC 14944]SFI75798.1 iron complex outermembrane recepter protein [Chryseobacterium indologenes]SUX50207.1 Ferric hydroxamate uptake [Chryseobacterium indologenes]